MSKKSTIKITCPKCGKESDFEVWESINTKIDPEAKQKVRSAELFAFTCPDCGNKTSVDYGFLYHQQEDKIWIQYCNSDENLAESLKFFSSSDKEEDEIVKGLRADKYIIRLVRSRNHLIEKLRIFDCGLNDMVIEVIKLISAGNFKSTDPDKRVADALFDVSPEGKYVIFYINTEGDFFASSEFPKELYDGLYENFKEKFPDPREGELVIDAQWAFKAMQG